jgi:hypothetical protein
MEIRRREKPLTRGPTCPQLSERALREVCAILREGESVVLPSWAMVLNGIYVNGEYLD